MSRGELVKGLRLQEGQLNHCVYAHDPKSCVRDTRFLGNRCGALGGLRRVWAQSLKNRIADVQSARVVTANENLRGKTVTTLKSIIDAAISDLPFLTKCLVFRCTDAKTADTCARRVNQQKGHSKALLLPQKTSCSCCKPLVPQKTKRNAAHHGKISYVVVAHGETTMTPSRTLTGLLTPTSSAHPSRTDVSPSCSSRCSRENLGRY